LATDFARSDLLTSEKNRNWSFHRRENTCDKKGTFSLKESYFTAQCAIQAIQKFKFSDDYREMEIILDFFIKIISSFLALSPLHLRSTQFLSMIYQLLVCQHPKNSPKEFPRFTSKCFVVERFKLAIRATVVKRWKPHWRLVV